MRVVGRREFDAFMAAHADSRPALAAWLARVAFASWASPRDVLAAFPRASVVRNGIMVFRIKGNDYRLVARFSFANGIARVLRVGTHAEYDGWQL